MKRKRVNEETLTVRTEYISPRTTLVWDPETGKGYIEWNVEEVRTVGSELLSSQFLNMFQTQFEEILTQIFDINDPVLGKKSKISGAGVMKLFKILFDEEWKEFELETGLVLPPQEEPEPSTLPPTV